MLANQPKWDLAFYRYINSGMTADWADPYISFISSTGLWVGVFLVALATALALRKWYWVRMLGLMAITIGVTDATSTYLFKPVFARERPCHYVPGARRVNQFCGSMFGMPSNHAANGMAAVTILGFFAGRTWFAVAAFFALLVGFTRLYLGVHYVTDLFVGYFLGAVIAALMCLLFAPLIRGKDETRNHT